MAFFRAVFFLALRLYSSRLNFFFFSVFFYVRFVCICLDGVCVCVCMYAVCIFLASTVFFVVVFFFPSYSMRFCSLCMSYTHSNDANNIADRAFSYSHTLCVYYGPSSCMVLKIQWKGRFFSPLETLFSVETVESQRMEWKRRIKYVCLMRGRERGPTHSNSPLICLVCRM